MPHQATLPRASLYGNNITLQGREMCSLPLVWPLLSRECLGQLTVPTSFCQVVLEKVEMKVKTLPTSFQDSFNRPPNSLFNSLKLNLKLKQMS